MVYKVTKNNYKFLKTINGRKNYHKGLNMCDEYLSNISDESEQTLKEEDHTFMLETLIEEAKKIDYNKLKEDRENIEGSITYLSSSERLHITKNNGGKTSYYDLPKPNRKKLEELLTNFVQQVQTREAISIPLLTSRVIEAFPQTLNDLIEFKKMEFWRGEIIKAAYGLDGRIKKLAGYDELSAEERELNKIIYYAERRKATITRLKGDL